MKPSRNGSPRQQNEVRSDGDQHKRIIVVGGGVIGMTAAIVLAECGYRVTVIAQGFNAETVSSVAAAFWTPFHVNGERYVWARRSLEVFQQLQSVEDAGVRSVDGVEFFESREHLESWMSASWWHVIPSVKFRRVAQSELPRGLAHGVGFTVPVIHMPTYLRWLNRRAQERGVAIQLRSIDSIDDLASESALVVNATGIASHRLAGDKRVYGSLGQVVCVRRTPAVNRLVFMTTGEYKDEPAYIVPRISDVLLGGTTIDVKPDVVPEPDPLITRQIIDRCSRFVPELAGLCAEDILEVRVALRPCRHASLRLEADVDGFALPVVHAYGHGGAGVTLSWGTAEEVVRLVDELMATALRQPRKKRSPGR